MRCQTCNTPMEFIGQNRKGEPLFYCEREDTIYILDFDKVREVKINMKGKPKADKFNDIKDGNFNFRF